jgi:hypothetical protein
MISLMSHGFRKQAIDSRVTAAAGFLLIPLAMGVLALSAAAQTTEIQGQASAWFTIPFEKGRGLPVGLRYIPTFSLKMPVGSGWTFDLEASANAFFTVDASAGWGSRRTEVEPYRAWVRMTTDRFEARLGLQKIEFGSARILRPLMWFDRVDPNDPLQLTDGVTGLLLKYTFQNNAAVWGWGLTGNYERKGWETFPTRGDDTLELGGRAQVPAFGGEIAVTFHRRRLDAFGGLLPVAPDERASVPETRLGFDGYWDVGPGLWFEAVFTTQDFAVSPYRFQKAINVGAENTFGLGGGLTVLAEHLFIQSSLGFWEAGTNRSLSALSLDLPLGLLDRVRATIFRDWTGGDWYRLLTWQRTTDRWSFTVIAFWNPETYGLYGGSSGSNLFGGRGLYLMVTWNH